LILPWCLESATGLPACLLKFTSGAQVTLLLIVHHHYPHKFRVLASSQFITNPSLQTCSRKPSLPIQQTLTSNMAGGGSNGNRKESRKESRDNRGSNSSDQSFSSIGHAYITRGRTRPNVPITSKFKTEMCHYLREHNECPFSSYCTYAHSASELRYIERHPKHKTQLCRDFNEVGYCSFGERCSFVHHHPIMTDLLRKIAASLVKLSAQRSVRHRTTSAEILMTEEPINYENFAEGVTDTVGGDSGPRHSDPINPLEQHAIQQGCNSVTSMDYLRPSTASSGYQSGNPSPATSPFPELPRNSSSLLFPITADCEPWSMAADEPVSPVKPACTISAPSATTADGSSSTNESELDTAEEPSSPLPPRQNRLPVFRSICDDSATQHGDKKL